MLNDTQRTAPADSKQAYASPVLTTYGDLATLTKTSTGSGSGKIGAGFDGRSKKT
jgi:hypothetical protein